MYSQIHNVARITPEIENSQTEGRTEFRLSDALRLELLVEEVNALEPHPMKH